MNRAFFDMFGNLTDKTMSDEDLRNLQLLRKDVFSGYSPDMLQQHVTNNKLYRPEKLGYEGIFNQAASAFSPKDPMAFTNWFYNNARNMDPGGLAKFMKYVQTINAASERPSTEQEHNKK